MQRAEREREKDEGGRGERDRRSTRSCRAAEKKLSAGICIEYSLTFLARLPPRRQIGRLRRAPPTGRRSLSLYHCAYLCTLIISNMVRALSSRTTVLHALLLPNPFSLSLSLSLSVARVAAPNRVRGLVYTYLGAWMECAPIACGGCTRAEDARFDSFSRRSTANVE